ncbi:hypothetical protein MMH89_02620 [Candidatus Comchoanobacter bicostacola]|uniref:Uncharacterized protein n=1 Tax=Candidatus Comchoanobacter bicostacola TaxID=2919598 RepID=A0ABY5DH80_9GAMM|nr:hypothetical protein [Candidatus Comchoanobacter bicostacola]UTC24118.1 hypothetical protein MMH89_02620 [Candidatus Comchoanobacter bicostacola]
MIKDKLKGKITKMRLLLLNSGLSIEKITKHLLAKFPIKILIPVPDTGLMNVSRLAMIERVRIFLLCCERIAQLWDKHSQDEGENAMFVNTPSLPAIHAEYLVFYIFNFTELCEDRYSVTAGDDLVFDSRECSNEYRIGL